MRKRIASTTSKLPMESAVDTEVGALLQKVATSLKVSEQSARPNSGDRVVQPVSKSHTSISGVPDQEDDCFYDCEESLDTVESLGDRKKTVGLEKTLAQDMESGDGSNDRMNDKQADLLDTEQRFMDALLGEDALNKTTGNGDVVVERGIAAEGEEKLDPCDVEEDEMSDGGIYSESELKEEENKAPEFDDDYLREVEKDLTEEEREGRRQESMILKDEGNSQFKNGEHSMAEQSYTSALGVCPVCYSKERAVLFSNRAAARLHLDQKEKAISDCSRAIELNPDYIRAILRRAELYEKTDKLDEALEEYKAALEKDPGQASAREACRRLPQQINERNEKLKEEMMSKLKDLGNMFLRPFGLSTNNFQVNQDNSSGSYSVNFVQNPNNNNR